MTKNRNALTAKQLLNFLLDLQESQDLDHIEINFRFDYDSGVVPVREIAEDLYIDGTDWLESLVLVSEPDAETL